MPFSNRLKAFAAVGADGTAVLTINPPPALMRTGHGSLQRVVASVPLPAAPQVLTDSFNTAVASGWGQPDTGPPFVVQGQNLFTVAGGFGVITSDGIAGGDVLSAVGLADVDIFAQIPSGLPAIVMSALNGFRIIFRAIDDNNYYFFGFQTAGTGVISIGLFKRVAGVSSLLFSLAGAPLIGAAAFNVRVTVTGSTITLKFWLPANAEPAAVNISFVDLTFTLPGSIGMGMIATTFAGYLANIDNMIVNALSAVAPIWDAYLGPVLPQYLVDSSVVAASRWVPTLATGQDIYRGEQLNVVARGAPVGQQVELQATIVTE